MAVFVIEHLEPRVWKWCTIEYAHISKTVGKKSLWFTNTNSKVLKKYGRVLKKSVSKLGLKNACVLDPEAKKVLTPKEAKKFKFFIFGGILGDYPPRKRTKKELTTRLKGAAARNIGREQFSTDNAVFVVQQIVKGRKMRDIKFVDGAEIIISKGESIQLPYKYAVVKGKPFMSKALIKFLKKKKGF